MALAEISFNREQSYSKDHADQRGQVDPSGQPDQIHQLWQHRGFKSPDLLFVNHEGIIDKFELAGKIAEQIGLNFAAEGWDIDQERFAAIVDLMRTDKKQRTPVGLPESQWPFWVHRIRVAGVIKEMGLADGTAEGNRLLIHALFHDAFPFTKEIEDIEDTGEFLAHVKEHQYRDKPQTEIQQQYFNLLGPELFKEIKFLNRGMDIAEAVARTVHAMPQLPEGENCHFDHGCRDLERALQGAHKARGLVDQIYSADWTSRPAASKFNLLNSLNDLTSGLEDNKNPVADNYIPAFAEIVDNYGAGILFILAANEIDNLRYPRQYYEGDSKGAIHNPYPGSREDYPVISGSAYQNYLELRIMLSILERTDHQPAIALVKDTLLPIELDLKSNDFNGSLKKVREIVANLGLEQDDIYANYAAALEETQEIFSAEAERIERAVANKLSTELYGDGQQRRHIPYELYQERLRKSARTKTQVKFNRDKNRAEQELDLGAISVLKEGEVMVSARVKSAKSILDKVIKNFEAYDSLSDVKELTPLSTDWWRAVLPNVKDLIGVQVVLSDSEVDSYLKEVGEKDKRNRAVSRKLKIVLSRVLGRIIPKDRFVAKLDPKPDDTNADKQTTKIWDQHHGLREINVDFERKGHRASAIGHGVNAEQFNQELYCEVFCFREVDFIYQLLDRESAHAVYKTRKQGINGGIAQIFKTPLFVHREYGGDQGRGI